MFRAKVQRQIYDSLDSCKENGRNRKKLGFTPISLNLSGVLANSEQRLELALKMSAASNG
jgi:hypothetical protein